VFADGAGYLLAHAPDNEAFRRNVVRFNISENDGRKNGYAGLDLWGRVAETQIYHNTVFVSSSRTGTPKALRIFNYGIPDHDVRDVLIANNLLMTSGRVPLVEVSEEQLNGARNLRFQGNNYFSATRDFSIRWAGRRFASLESWRKSVAQEIRDGIAIGLSADPKLSNPGKGGFLVDLAQPGELVAYRLKKSSPMRHAGLNLQTLFGVERGVVDYFGTDLTTALGVHIGADQSPGNREH
ncbi:MAG: beta-glucosidase, partial [Opitutaceae bacterium]|nr:beta-glucosidase [Verrucomicrobiales bacterium]